MKKIALEEHFSGPGFGKYMNVMKGLFEGEILASMEELLSDFDEQRLKAMDEAGIEVSVLSQTAPGLQAEADVVAAVQSARRCNDFLFEQIQRHPSRYRGFACLPMQDPVAAANELERCVRDYKFVGALVNGHTQGVYLDDRSFWPFWEKVQELDVPFYLHPMNPFDEPHVYSGRPELNGAVYSWTCETAAHALRLVFGGVFDDFPGLRVILGHMGEGLPFMLWRLDSRIKATPFAKALKRMPSEVIRRHFVVTTSGACADNPLLCTVSELGEDNVLFSVDYPYESSRIAAKFIENAPFSESIREKLCYKNAERVLRITL